MWDIVYLVIVSALCVIWLTRVIMDVGLVELLCGFVKCNVLKWFFKDLKSEFNPLRNDLIWVNYLMMWKVECTFEFSLVYFNWLNLGQMICYWTVSLKFWKWVKSVDIELTLKWFSWDMPLRRLLDLACFELISGFELLKRNEKRFSWDPNRVAKVQVLGEVLPKFLQNPSLV